MTRRLLRPIGTVLLIAVALVTPTVVTTSAPASADMVVDGCTVVSNPTPTHFTNCPNANLAGANLAGVDLSYANLAGASFMECPVYGMAAHCTGANLTDATLTDANLSGASFFSVAEFLSPAFVDVHGANFSGADLLQAALDTGLDFSDDNLSGANLTGDTLGDTFVNTNLSDANLNGASMGYSFDGFIAPANLEGANLTGTLLVPPNKSVTATSQAGALATWPTPSAIPGATPGNCTSPSGSTFPLFSTTVTCQVLDHAGDVATGTFQVNVQSTTHYFTRVGVPSDGAVLAGRTYLDAGAADSPGVTKVVFEVSSGTLSDQVVATTTPTYYGWLAQWNTTVVPNGTYTLQSVATDADNNTDTSTPITVTVNNQPPVTAVIIPSNGATQSGATALLDASASSAVGIASVTFEVSGGALSDQVVATATPTLYGWLAQWNTTAVPNGTYTLQSVATDTVAETTKSLPITVTVVNPAPTTTVTIPSYGATLSGSTLLDASATNATSVEFRLFGGVYGLNAPVICTATPTYYGWLCNWNTATVPSGTYFLASEAFNSAGSAFSSGVSVTVVSLADLQSTSTFAGTFTFLDCALPPAFSQYDATYPGSTSVGTVTLTVSPCSSSFTISTGVGTLSGTVGPASLNPIPPDGLDATWPLNVVTGTGLFAGMTGVLFFYADSPGTGSFSGNVSLNG